MALYEKYVLELVEAVPYTPGRGLEDGLKCFMGTCRLHSWEVGCSGCDHRHPYLVQPNGVEVAILKGDYIVFKNGKKELRRKAEFEREYKMVEGSGHVDY